MATPIERLGSVLRPTPGRVAAGLVGLCLAGFVWQQMAAKSAADARDQAERHRAALMDAEMGGIREAVARAFRESPLCKARGISCMTDWQPSEQFWFRQTMKGRDLVDVEIPWREQRGPKRVRVRLFMRDASATIATAEDPVLRMTTAALSMFALSPAAISACMAADAAREIADGQKRLVCERIKGSRYGAVNGDLIVGSQWRVEVMLP